MSAIKTPDKKATTPSNGGSVAQGYKFIAGYPTNITIQKVK